MWHKFCTVYHTFNIVILIQQTVDKYIVLLYVCDDGWPLTFQTCLCVIVHRLVLSIECAFLKLNRLNVIPRRLQFFVNGECNSLWQDMMAWILL